MVTSQSPRLVTITKEDVEAAIRNYVSNKYPGFERANVTLIDNAMCVVNVYRAELTISGKPVLHKDKPVAIWHAGDANAFHEASKEERDAWNDYANEEAAKFQRSLDAYETVHGHIGYDRDGKITAWCPPMFFPEWLEQYRKENPNEGNQG